MCQVTDFVSSLAPGHLFRRLLGNDVPSLELVITEPANLQESIEQWSFIGRFFGEARKPISFKPAIMPILTYLTVAKGSVPSLDRVTGILAPYSNVEPSARVYSCLTAWLRELAVARYLSDYGPVSKNLLWDLERGVDLLWRGRKIAIAHRGDTYLAGKRLKADPDVVYLFTESASRGLHMVPRSEIEDKLLR